MDNEAAEGRPVDACYRLLVERLDGVGVLMLDGAGVIRASNDAAARLLQAGSALEGRPLSQLLAPGDAAARGLDVQTHRLDGADRGRAVSACVIRPLADTAHGAPPLDDSERRFKLLVQGVTDYAIYMLDPQGRVANWNAGAQRIKGYDEREIVGQHFRRFFTDEDREAGEAERALATAAAEGRYEREAWRQRKDGSRFRAHVVLDAIRSPDGTLLGYAKITRDITERYEAQQALEQAQAALFHAQKLEAIGRLTGGVAHDFNNLLTVIVNNLALLARLTSDPRAHRMIASGQRAVEQGAKLTQQLLAFARRQPLVARVLDVDALIRGFAAVLGRACGARITMSLQLERSGLAALVDGQQLEAALLNLVVNAVDAMPDGGRLTLSTRSVDAPAGGSLLGGGLPPGRYVAIGVQDTGVGMTPDVLAHALEPFFTTKEVGKGTGLGLSQVYGFASQSGGSVDIRTAPGAGTTVELWLPRASGIEASVESADALPDAAQPSRRTALIVEDDDDVREVAVELFRSLGFDPISASDAGGALAVLESDAALDVMFSDVVMPRGQDGVQLARRARELRPSLKILLASGFPGAALEADGRLLHDFQFVGKPYRWSELAEKLRG